MTAVRLTRLIVFALAILWSESLIRGEDLVPARVEPVGLTGAAATYHPGISPHDRNLMFVAVDMSAIYRSRDGGRSWEMIDERQVRGFYAPVQHAPYVGRDVIPEERPSARFFFHPTDPDVLFTFGEHERRRALLVSRDRGTSWSVFAEVKEWTSNPITGLAIDPEVSSRFVVSTTEGIYRSRDHGQTWQRCAGVRGLSSDLFLDLGSPAEQRRLFVATPDGVFASTDGGATWHDSSEGLPWRAICHLAGGLEQDAGLILYVTIESKVGDGEVRGGLYRSTDGGNSWSSVLNGPLAHLTGGASGIADFPQLNFLAVAAHDARKVYVTAGYKQGWAGGGRCPLYKSDDAGQSWHCTMVGQGAASNVTPGWIALEIGWAYGLPALGLAACGTDPDRALVTTMGQLYVTDDGGRTWRPGDSVLARSEDKPQRGARYQVTGLQATGTQVYYIDPHHPQRHFLATGDVSLERSDDGGASWSYAGRRQGWRNTFYELAFDPEVADRMWAAVADQHNIPYGTEHEGPRVGMGGGVAFSDDGGLTWTEHNEGLPNRPIVSVILDPDSPKDQRRLWASAYGEGVYRSDDGGRTWVKKSAGLCNPGNLHVYRLQRHRDGSLFCNVTGRRVPNDPITGKNLWPNWYTIPGGLWRSRDGGERWECLTAELKPLVTSDYAVHPTDSQTIYLCVGHATSQQKGVLARGGLYKSTDGGRTWEMCPVPLQAPYMFGGRPADPFAPGLAPWNPEIVFVTTTGNGTWVSNDGGKSWGELRGIPFLATQTITFGSGEAEQLYISTYGGGAWRVTLRARR